MINSIPIFDNYQINPFFVKANNEILTKFKVENPDQLVNCWKKQYNAELDLKNYQISFIDETKMLHFILNLS